MGGEYHLLTRGVYSTLSQRASGGVGPHHRAISPSAANRAEEATRREVFTATLVRFDEQALRAKVSNQIAAVPDQVVVATLGAHP